MMKVLIFITSLFFSISALSAEKNSYISPLGFVPNEETAIQIAIAVWSPKYGEDKIKKEKPYKAVLSDGIWTVTGSLKKGWKGGVAIIEIAKEDGRVIYVNHGK